MSSSATIMIAHAQGMAVAVAAQPEPLSAGCTSSPSACFRAHHAQSARLTADASTSASLLQPAQWSPQMRTTTSGFLGTEWGNGVDIGILVGAIVAVLLLCCSLYCCCSPTRKKLRKGADTTTIVNQAGQPNSVPMMATPMQQQAAAAAADPYAAQRRVQEQEAATLAADRRRFEMEREIVQMEQAAAANRAAAAAAAAQAPPVPARPASGSFDHNDTPDHPVTIAYSTVPPPMPMDEQRLPAINPYLIPPSNSLAESFAQHEHSDGGRRPSVSGARRSRSNAVPASALNSPYTGVPRAHASRGFAYEEEDAARGDWEEEDQPDDIPVIGYGQFATLTRA